MFEVRPIGTRTKFKPVKKPAPEIPSVELVAKLVEVELEELRFYVMVSVQYAPLGVADDNVYPWQDFPDTHLLDYRKILINTKTPDFTFLGVKSGVYFVEH